jgi:broad specificity phosphatase PhoE
VSQSLHIVYLARHCETAWSLTGQHAGLTDLPLTEHGEAVARSLTNRLNTSLSRLFSSVSCCALAGPANWPVSVMSR